MSRHVGNAHGEGMTADTRRIGLFGGTFDPPHVGHLVAAHQVRELHGLDEVWLVVANEPWQKDGTRSITDVSTRMMWVAASIDGVAGLAVSDIEVRLGGPSYTIDTLAALEAQHPDVAWSVIVGADAAGGLDSWHRAEELREMADVIVVNRPGDHPPRPPGWRVSGVEIPPLDVSSSELRAMVAAGRSIRFLVRDAVAESVQTLGVYRSSS